MTSKSRIKKLVNLAVTVCNNESLKGPQPISFEDLINSAEVVFEDNDIPLEVTTVKNNENIENQSSDNTLLLESELISLNDLEININELITNDFSGVQENSVLENCAEINSNSSKIKRKRNVYPDNTKWKRETNKKLRMKGEAYIGFSRVGNVVQQDISRSERSLLDTCSSNVCLKSKNRFCSSFTEEQRQNIFDHFWKASWEEKETFVLGTVLVTEVKRKTTVENTRRSKTYNYHLRYKNSLPIQVCKKMFLNILCLKEWMVLNWVKKK